MKTFPAAAITAFAIAVAAAPARADDKAACFAAATQGQRLRNQHKLVEAREQFRACARLGCPALVAKDCSSWLDGVEQGLPTVVVTAKDGAGRDLVDVRVTMDGKPLANKLDGEAIAVDPGTHSFRFVAADGQAADANALIREGAKNQSVAVVIGPPPAAPAPAEAPPSAPPPAPVAAPPPANVSPAPAPGEASPAPAARGTSGWHTAGWVSLGVGLAGLAAGTGFGIKAILDKNRANCDASGACDAGPLSDLQTSSTVSTVSFIAGGALTASGLAILIITSGRGESSSEAGLRLAPSLGSADRGIVLQGRW